MKDYKKLAQDAIEHSSHYYWLSFWASPADLAQFECHLPWWVSGYDDARESVVAAIPANSPEQAQMFITASFDAPVAVEWRFCNKRDGMGRPKSSRFPMAEWMLWKTE